LLDVAFEINFATTPAVQYHTKKASIWVPSNRDSRLLKENDHSMLICMFCDFVQLTD